MCPGIGRNMPAYFKQCRVLAKRARYFATGTVRSSTQRGIVVEGDNSAVVTSLRTDLPIPQPEENQVLVKVEAAGINLLDCFMSTGYARSVFPGRKVLGRDFSGTVAAVGSNIWEHKVGDEVFGVVPPWDGKGTFCEYCTAEEAWIAKKPENLSHSESTTLPFASLTVKHTLLSALDSLNFSKRALVVGGSGSVGSIAVQLLKLRNDVWVSATSSVKHKSRLESYGVDLVIDHSNDDWIDAIPESLDLIFVATSHLHASYEQALRRKLHSNGYYLQLNTPLIRALDSQGPLGALDSFSQFLGKHVAWRKESKHYQWSFFCPFSTPQNRLFLKQLASSAEENRILPFVGKCFAFEKYSTAFELALGGAFGKLVLLPSAQTSIG